MMAKAIHCSSHPQLATMGVCTGCAILFRKLTEDQCMKCIKLSRASSTVEREAIEAQPQCEGCSVVFPYMKNVLCGACREADSCQETEAAGAGASSLTDNILGRAAAFQASANQHRLSQPAPKNKSLEAADAARLKAKLAALHKQTKSDVITAEASLFYYPKNGTAAKKVFDIFVDRLSHITDCRHIKAQLLPDYKKYFGTDPAKTLLDGVRGTLEKAWLMTPAASVNGVKLNFQDAEFGIVSAKSIINFKPTEEHLVGTVEAMFNNLRSESKVSDIDYKARKLTLRVYAHELASASTLSIIIARQVDDDDLFFTSTRPSARRSGTRSMARGQSAVKRKASTSISTTTEYTSAFRPRKAPVMPQIDFDKYSFEKIAFTADAEGNLDEFLTRDEEIEVAKGWRQFIAAGKAEGGYISKGATKYAFMGRIGSKMYAIFQCGVDSQVDEASNRADLIAELKLLALGQYFADSFATRAKACGVRIPKIRWNSEGAFVGKATNCWPDDESSLMFESFLAAPLLDTSVVYTERKFSGSDVAGRSADVVGSALDAYAHHTLVDTEGQILLTDLQGVVGSDQSVILFDPQAHSCAKDTGFWDQGSDGIKVWEKAHKCNELCKQLKLKDGMVKGERNELTMPEICRYEGVSRFVNEDGQLYGA
ncbi:hypothetical protein D9615_006391 [Tricholomella constricta]|uniref:Alpha-type protein kinase domain-containing protein n=1 Tax=Tricholomella constricta TaxID=117010 RepID=A0A8H5H5R0_9AGAR|nr:hypothetical protein D9615_006391 [Tricholomella constricta]